MSWLWYLVPIGAAVCTAAGFGAIGWGIITVIRAGAEGPDPKD